MPDIIKKSLNQPDETHTPENLKMEVVTVDGVKVHRITAAPGWRWTKHLKPLVKTDTCQMQHLLYIISGTLASQLTGGPVVEFHAGDVVSIPPGHDGWTVGDEPVVWIEIPR